MGPPVSLRRMRIGEERLRVQLDPDQARAIERNRKPHRCDARTPRAGEAVCLKDQWRDERLNIQVAQSRKVDVAANVGDQKESRGVSDGLLRSDRETGVSESWYAVSGQSRSDPTGARAAAS